MAIVSPDRSTGEVVLTTFAALALGTGGLLFGALLALLVGVALVGALGVDLSPAALVVLSLVFVQGVGCIGVGVAYLKLRPVYAPRVRDALDLEGEVIPFAVTVAVPSGRDLLVVAAGYVTALAGAFGGSVLVSTLAVDTGRNQAAEVGIQSPEVLLLLIPASILLIGPGEELLFRGVVQGRLRQVFGPAVGIAVPSLLFAGVHWFALAGGTTTGRLVAVSVLVVPAIVFGVSYEYTDNIVVPSLIHGVYNATLFSLLYVAVTYSDQFA